MEMQVEATQFIQIGFKAAMVRELQAEADRRALPLRTMIRSILAEHLDSGRTHARDQRPAGNTATSRLAAPGPGETS